MSKKEEKKEKTMEPSVKVILRRLPKHMTEQEVMEQISPLPEEVVGTYFTPANFAFDRCSYVTLTLHFSEYCESLVDFEQRFDGYIFVDSRGNDSAAVVEAAVNQKFAKCDRARLKEDSRVGAIHNDKYFLEFCQKLDEEKATPIMTLEQQIRLLNRPEDARTQISRLETPLVKFFMEREAGKRRDYDARRARRDEKRAAVRQKNVMDILMKPSAPSSAPPTSSAPKKELNAKDKEKIDAKRKERDALRKKKFLEEKKKKREERELAEPVEKPPREHKKRERRERPGRPSPAKTLGEQQGEDWIKKLTDPKAVLKKKSDLPDSKLTLLDVLKGSAPLPTQKPLVSTVPSHHNSNPEMKKKSKSSKPSSKPETSSKLENPKSAASQSDKKILKSTSSEKPKKKFTPSEAPVSQNPTSSMSLPKKSQNKKRFPSKNKTPSE